MTDGAQQALRRTMEIYSKTTRFALACNASDKIIGKALLVPGCSGHMFPMLLGNLRSSTQKHLEPAQCKKLWYFRKIKPLKHPANEEHVCIADEPSEQLFFMKSAMHDCRADFFSLNHHPVLLQLTIFSVLLTGCWTPFVVLPSEAQSWSSPVGEHIVELQTVLV